MRKACEKHGVPIRSFIKWAALPESQPQYARAREAQADATFDGIMELADDVLAGKYDYNTARVAIDALKWAAAKLRPRIYGDHIQVEQDTSIKVEVVLGTPQPPAITATLVPELANPAPTLGISAGGPVKRGRGRPRKGAPGGVKG